MVDCYSSDANQAGWTHGKSGTRRNITWDDVHGWTSVAGGRAPGATEENRIQAIADNGHTMTYTYDASGQRITKRGPQGETGYINQWMTLRNGEVGTKHVFAGTSRVVSKLVKQDKPNTKRNSGNNGNGKKQGKARIVYEKDQYYYHPDHLGTTAYITHTNGQIYQHLEYFPFGETWVEEHSNKQRTPYLFTAKELDEETGLYYFGARYYDPRTSVWQSPDPIFSDYVGSEANNLVNGGVFNSSNLAVYSYVSNSPLVSIDPDRNAEITENAIQYWQKKQETSGNPLYSVPKGLAFASNEVLDAGSVMGSGLADDFSEGPIQGVINFTGGENGGNSFSKLSAEIGENYSNTSLVADIANFEVKDLDKKAAAALVSGQMAEKGGGMTIGQWAKTGFAPAKHLPSRAATARLVGATSVLNAAATTAAYEGGNFVGFAARTGINRTFRGIKSAKNFLRGLW